MNDNYSTMTLLTKIATNEHLTMPQEQLYELIELAIKQSVYHVIEALDIIDYPFTAKLEQLITIEKYVNSHLLKFLCGLHLSRIN